MRAWLDVLVYELQVIRAREGEPAFRVALAILAGVAMVLGMLTAALLRALVGGL